MKKIFKAAEVPIKWDPQYVGLEVDERTNSMVSRENLDSVLVRSDEKVAPTARRRIRMRLRPRALRGRLQSPARTAADREDMWCTKAKHALVSKKPRTHRRSCPSGWLARG